MLLVLIDGSNIVTFGPKSGLNASALAVVAKPVVMPDITSEAMAPLMTRAEAGRGIR